MAFVVKNDDRVASAACYTIYEAEDTGPAPISKSSAVVDVLYICTLNSVRKRVSGHFHYPTAGLRLHGTGLHRDRRSRRRC